MARTLISIVAVLAILGLAYEVNTARALRTSLASASKERDDLGRRLRELTKRAAEARESSPAASQLPEAPSTTAGEAPPPEVIEDADLNSRLQRRYPQGIVAVVGSRAILVKGVGGFISPQQYAAIRKAAGSESEFGENIDKAIDMVIQNLVDRELIIGEFRRGSPGETEVRKIPDDVVDRQIAETEQAEFGGDRSKFLASIEAQGLTHSEYRQQVEDDIIFRYMLGQFRQAQAAGGATEGKTPAQLRDDWLKGLRAKAQVQRF